jgi:hypothetical protein
MKRNKTDHIHVVLPSGGIANVSPNCSIQTLKALDKLCELAKEKFSNEKK